MSKLSTIIIEDEPLAAELLEGYIKEIASLSYKGTFHDPIKALAYINKQHIDVIFLDLHLPKIKGFELMALLPYPVQVILTTAYHQYAVESYKYRVIDYLLKPVEWERFVIAVDKLSVHQQEEGVEKPDSLFFNVNKKRIKVNFSEMLMIESQKAYIKIGMVNGEEIVTKMSISAVEEILPEQFIRVHKSFIVNKDKITAYSANQIELGEQVIPIGRTFQKKLKIS